MVEFLPHPICVYLRNLWIPQTFEYPLARIVSISQSFLTMHPLRLTFTLIAAFATHALAAPIDVTKGFAGATWGMSPTEVAKATGAVNAGFVSVKPDVRRPPRPIESGSQDVADMSGVPAIIYVKGAEGNPITTLYVFYDNKLTQIYREAQLDTLGINPFAYLRTNITSDGSIALVPQPSLPYGSFTALKAVPSPLFSLTSLPLQKSAIEAWNAAQEADKRARESKFKADVLPKLLE